MDHGKERVIVVTIIIGIIVGFAVLMYMTRSCDEQPLPKKTYRLKLLEKVTWSEALGLCSSKGMRLATVDREAHLTFLMYFIEKLSKSTDDAYENYWLAGTNMREDGTFQRTNTGWFKGEHGSIEKRCVELQPRSNYRLSVETCSNRNYYICEEL